MNSLFNARPLLMRRIIPREVSRRLSLSVIVVAVGGVSAAGLLLAAVFTVRAKSLTFQNQDNGDDNDNVTNKLKDDRLLHERHFDPSPFSAIRKPSFGTNYNRRSFSVESDSSDEPPASSFPDPSKHNKQTDFQKQGSYDFENADEDDDDDDMTQQHCPICEKYGKGPCGNAFWTWWDCTEQNPAIYAKACASQFQQFQACLDQHEAEYSNSHKN